METKYFIQTLRKLVYAGAARRYKDLTPAIVSRIETHCEITGDIHTSGHADVNGLKRIVEHVHPKRIVPIHTENATLFFQKIFSQVTDNSTPVFVLYNNATFEI